MMKRFLILPLMATLSIQALGSDQSVNLLKLHWIKAPAPMNWNTPKGLLFSSIKNTLIGDYSIGHVAVEIECHNRNRYGIRHVLTGMTNVSGADTRDAVLKQGLAMSVVFHNFEGMIERSKRLKEDLVELEQKGRLETLVVPTTEARCDQMMEFMDRWIRHGSYRIYGGNKNVYLGEGSGCADFARVFFEISTGSKMPEAWIVRRKVPLRFMGSKDDPISILEFLMKKNTWAKEDEPFKEYVTPDPTWVNDWIREQKQTKFGEYIWTGKVDQKTPKALPKFKYKYVTQLSTQEMWERIHQK